jgi:hypothetical protein
MQGQRDRLESGAEVKPLAFAALLSISAASAQAPEPVPSEDLDVRCGKTHCIVKRHIFDDLSRAKAPIPCWRQIKERQ